MRKRMLALLAALALLLSMLPAAVAEEVLTTQEQVRELLEQTREAGEEAVSFTCEEALFDEMRENSYAGLRQILALVGMVDYELKYNYSGYMEFSGIQWGAPAVECGGELSDLVAALNDCAEARMTDFTILCDPGLCHDIYVNNEMNKYMARAGIDDGANVSYDTSGGGIYFRNVPYVEIPWAIVDSVDDVLSAAAVYRASEVSSFRLVFTDEFYDEWRNDYSLPERTEMAAYIESSDTSRDIFALYYQYDNVKWDDTPRAICQTEADIVEAIRLMGAAGATRFYLILDKDLYDRVYEGYFAGMGPLQNEAGMSEGDMSYYPSLYILLYENARIVADVVALNDPLEAVEFTAQKVAEGEKSIDLFCSPELYEYLVGDISPYRIVETGMDPIYDVAAHAGINDYGVLYSGQTHIITLQVSGLYPGTAIVNAVRAGDESVLTDRERETLAAARTVAEQAAQDSPLETARSIHDWLCEANVYTDDEAGDEDDCAIGAILNGQANCDGYADAFYLIGTLAGLNVRCQHGDSYNIGYNFDFMNPITHMWNLMEIDGTWRLVDVTWDDEEDGYSYTWFNLGEDRASRMHFWNEGTTVALQPETDLSVRPENEFWITDGAGALEAIREASAAKMARFTLIYADEALAENWRDALNAVQEIVHDSFNYQWNERMFSLEVLDAKF